MGYDAPHCGGMRALSAKQQILLIGFGNMGQALVRGWLANGRDPATIRVVDTAGAAVAAAATLGVESSATAAAAFTSMTPDVVVLAVKPNQIAAVLGDCAAVTSAVFLSIAAGKTLVQLEAGLGAGAAVVRAMPNTPAAIGRGMTGLVANRAVTAAQRVLCGELLSAVGAVAWLSDEGQMDAVTAVSGSGPAYVFLLIECLERAGRELGLDEALAKQLAVATVAGAGLYAAQSDVDAAELRKRVTSPNGTTQAALEVLMADTGMAALMTRAVRAAAARSRELSAV